MHTPEFLLTLGISLFFVIWGALIRRQKATWLLAGWNTMGKSARNAYSKPALCRLYGTCVMFFGAGAFLLLCGSFCGRELPLCLGLGVMAAAVILSLVLPLAAPGKFRNRM